MTALVQLVLAILTAAANGATAVRVADQPEPAVIVEYVTPHCPTFDDEPCYVIVDADLAIEVGP